MKELGTIKDLMKRPEKLERTKGKVVCMQEVREAGKSQDMLG